MTAPLSIFAEALDCVNANPATRTLSQRGLAERAAWLVLGAIVEEPEVGALPYRSPLIAYLGELQTAKANLAEALARLGSADEDSETCEADSLFDFERAEAVYYQAASNVAELVRRMTEAPRS